MRLSFIFLLAVFLSNMAAGQVPSDKLPPEFIDFKPEKKLVLLDSLCWNNRERDSEMALQYGLEGIRIASKHELESYLAKFYNYVGVIYQHYMKDTRKAIPYYDRGMFLSLQQADSIEIGYVYNNLGDAFYSIGNIPLAKEYADKSLTIFRKINFPKGIAYSYVNYGYVYELNQQYDSALFCFQNAIDIRQGLNDSVGVASAILEKARILNSLGEYAEAAGLFRQSLQLHTVINNKNYMAYSLEGMGDNYFKTGFYDSAFNAYQKAFNLNRERNNHSSIVSTQLGIGLTLLKLGREKEGEELMEQALAHSQEYGNNSDLLIAHKRKAEFLTQQGNLQEAVSNYEAYLEIYDSLYNDMQFRTMLEVESRFKVREELNEIQRNLEDKTKSQLYFFAIIIILLGSGIYLIVLLVAKSRLSRKLKISNQTKDKVFEIMAHDLINPFNSMLGFSNLLESYFEKGDYHKLKESIAIVKSTAQETFDLTSKLLNWSSVQRNKIEPSPRIFDMSEFIQELLPVLDSQAMQKDILLRSKIPGSTFVFADPSFVRTILSNLVSNAIKFTPKNGEVEIRSSSIDSKVKISVKDNGLGISSDRIQKILKEETVSNTLGTEREKGTGIGLMVSREFIKLSNGEMYIESSEDEGSTFSFTLPVSKA